MGEPQRRAGADARFLTPRRALIALGVVAGVVALWFSGPALIRSLAFFRVRRVEVVGARWLAPETIVRAMRVPARASVADPLVPYMRRVREVPGVAAVDVARRLPGALVVTIREREPVAYAPVDGVLTPVDGMGRVLPFDARRGAASLPLLNEPDALAARVLARLRTREPGLFDAVTDARRDGQDVVLRTPNGLVRLDGRSDTTAMRNVRIIGDRLAAERRPWGELDGRFAGMVIRRGSGA